MKVTSSYRVKITNMDAVIRDTVAIYRKALAFLIEVVEAEWPVIEPIYNRKKLLAQGCVEKLIISTKTNTAKYPFEVQFYKMPCYLRRAAITNALGCVSSYHSAVTNWAVNGKKGNCPVLQKDRFAMPVFYRDNMYKKQDGQTYLKLYKNKDWVWVAVSLRHTDLAYLQKHWSHIKAAAPVLEKRYHRYYLRFAFTEDVLLTQTLPADQLICAVDLGINTDAVCSIMQSDGTVVGRKFINFPTEKDHLTHTLNKIKKKQHDHGNSNLGSIWEYAKNCNDQLAIKTATAITKFAVSWGCDVIVFEYLDIHGKKKGSKKQKLAMWKKNSVQTYTAQKAHRYGMRVTHICAWNTSKLAFDGSGILDRDNRNHQNATFASGKQYNCDLSASYNLGARYFIREIMKSLPVTVRSQLVAKVPQAEIRTQSTLSTLISLNVALSSIAA